MSFYPPAPQPTITERIAAELAKEQAAYEIAVGIRDVPEPDHEPGQMYIPLSPSSSPDPGEANPETEEV